MFQNVYPRSLHELWAPVSEVVGLRSALQIRFVRGSLVAGLNPVGILFGVHSMREAKTCMQALAAPSRAPPSLHGLPTVYGSQGPAFWALWLESQGFSFLGLPGTNFERVRAREVGGEAT